MKNQLIMPEIMKAMNLTKRPDARDKKVYEKPVKSLLEKINKAEVKDGDPITEKDFVKFYLKHIGRNADHLFDGETIFEGYMEYFKYADWQYSYLKYFERFHDEVVCNLQDAECEWAKDYIEYGILKPFPNGTKVKVKVAKYGKERILEGEVLSSNNYKATSLIQIGDNKTVFANWEDISTWA